MDVVIIGNGIAGSTAARHIRKRDSSAKITMISGETDHFYSRTALMYIYMGHMRFNDIKPYEDWFWDKNRIDLKRAWVSSVDLEQKIILFSDGNSLSYDKLIIATGSSPNKFGWPGQDLDAVQGLYHYQDLESMESDTKGIARAVIVGGGLIGIEMAEMLLSRNIPVTFIVRETSFWNAVMPPEESAMLNKHIIEHHVDLRLSTELKEILADDKGRARAVVTGSGEEIACQFVGLTAGVHPNISFLKNTELEIDRGIVVNEYLQTNIPDVYAIGDCAQTQNPPEGRRPIEAVWYVGKIMGEHVAQTICEERTKYEPGLWFNSAKFFDIEYQVYGNIPTQLTQGINSLYWEDPKTGKRSIRINYNSASGEVTGFNLMGIRYRHKVCDEWIRCKTPIQEVLQNLGAANFDPEFFPQYEQAIVALYNEQKPGAKIRLTKKRGLKGMLQLLKIKR